MPDRIELSKIVLDAGTQMRERIDESVVAEYADVLDQLPAVAVYAVGRRFVLVDGFHRYYAHSRAEARDILATVIGSGTIEEARWIACAANATHGLRRSNESKRLAVEAALMLRPGSSDREVAAHVGVSHTMVAKMRRSIDDAASGKPIEAAKSGNGCHSYGVEEDFHADEVADIEPLGDDLEPSDSEAPVGAPVTLDERIAHARARIGVLLKGLERWRAEADRIAAEEAGSGIHIGTMDQYWRDLRLSIDRARPAGPCPKCKGGGCPACGNLGWISKMRAQVLRGIEG
jgi:hypothetical protein